MAKSGRSAPTKDRSWDSASDERLKACWKAYWTEACFLAREHVCADWGNRGLFVADDENALLDRETWASISEADERFRIELAASEQSFLEPPTPVDSPEKLVITCRILIEYLDVVAQRHDDIANGQLERESRLPDMYQGNPDYVADHLMRSLWAIMDKFGHDSLPEIPPQSLSAHDAAGVLYKVISWCKGVISQPPMSPPLTRDQTEATKPAKLLLNWGEIMEALGRKNTPEGRGQIRSLNKNFNGPIKMPSKGGQPKADREKLLNWWNNLENEHSDGQVERKERQANRAATVSSWYSHGKNGIVVPEVAGSVKSRRGNKQ